MMKIGMQLELGFSNIPPELIAIRLQNIQLLRLGRQDVGVLSAILPPNAVLLNTE